MCRDVLVMRAGRIVRAGPAADLLALPGIGAQLPSGPVRTGGVPVLEAAGLVRRYRLPDASWRTAVDGVGLRIEPGELVGLVGASGSGKSTLARLLTGLERPDAGQVRLDGRDPALRDAARHSVQFVFQDPFDLLDPRWKVGRIVAEPLAHDRLPVAESRERIDRALREVDLPADAAGRYPHAFSGGQRQRIAIARALVARPNLVVLDEPLSALDQAIQAQLLDLLDRLRLRHGLAFLLVSHDLDVVRRLCSRVLVLDEGRIVETGHVGQVLRQPRSAAARALVAALPGAPVAPQQAGDY